MKILYSANSFLIDFKRFQTMIKDACTRGTLFMLCMPLIWGTPTYGCPSGRYGSLCGSPCQCNNRCDILTGECIDDTCPQTCRSCDNSNRCIECTDGWYGAKCNNKCRGICNGGCGQYVGNCNACNQVSGECIDVTCHWIKHSTWRSQCTTGACGAVCNYACPNNCIGGCDQYSGYCNACFHGYFGSQCEHVCTNCRGNNCTQEGKCSSCYDGKHGLFCNKTCSNDCISNVCNQIDGSCEQCPVRCLNCTDSVTCTKCEASRYGDFCGFVCGNTCKDGQCDIASGACSECKELTIHGPFCNHSCSDNCNDGQCIQENGNCSNGCIADHYGPTCDNVCSENCADSTTETTCDSTGNCYSGCVDGFIGDTCTTISESGKQSPVSTEKETCVVIGVAVGGVLAVCVVVAVVAIVVLKRNGIVCKERKMTYEDVSPDRNQDKPYTTLAVANTSIPAEYEIPDSELRSGASIVGTDNSVYYNDEKAYYKNVGGHVQNA